MKSLFSSKVFWLAVAQAIAGVVMVFSHTYPDVGFIAVVKSAVDIILRLLTSEPVTV